MMLSNSVSFPTLPRLIRTPAYLPPPRAGVQRILGVGPRRGISVVTRAGPSTTSYIFAFVFPLSLLAVTIFTSARIADKLDQKYLEELAVNQAILEAEENDDDDEVSIPSEEEPSPVRRRNRPKREVETSSV